MHILMISFDPALARDGEARQRHIAYAERAGHLTIVTHTRRGANTNSGADTPRGANTNSGADTAPTEASPHLTILPTNSLTALRFPVDAYRMALEQAQQRPVDLIVTQDVLLTGLVGVWLRRQLNAPLLVQNHTYLFGNRAWLAEHPVRNRLLLRLAHYVIRRADMVRTVNQKERENAMAMGFAAERVVSLPLATASEAFAAPVAPALLDERRTELGLTRDDKVIIWVGYPVATKRVPLLLQVFRRIMDAEPKARLLLLGDMSRSPQNLNAIAQAEGIAERVIMRGPIRHDDLPAYYALANVYAHTSSYEGVPRVLAEASAAGLPLVGMNVVGVNEVIENDVNGCLVRDGDVQAMADAIVSLLRDPERARAFGTAAQRIALERYNAADYADKWVDVWKRAIALGKRP